MAFRVTRTGEPDAGSSLVTVHIGLSQAETNALFLSGDSIISWPEAGLLGEVCYEGWSRTDSPMSPPMRTGMFVSELARFAQGFKIRYRQPADADRAAQLIRLQLLRAGIEEEET